MDDRIVVMYDVDSTLWPLEERVAEEIGVRVEQLAVYNYLENPALTSDQQKRALEVVSDARFFRDINFFPGVDEILKVREDGAEVILNTNSLTKEIRDTKNEQLLAAIPGLRPEDIQSRVTGVGEFSKKFPEDCKLVVAEDSPYSVAESPAMMNVLRKLPWNRSQNAINIMLGKPVVWCKTLLDINNYIRIRVQVLRHDSTLF